MILIGSRALKIRAPFILRRQPLDYDFICSFEEYENYLNINKNKVIKAYDIPGNKIIKIIESDSINEFEIIEKNKSSEMFKDLVNADPETIISKEGYKIPSLDLLFTLKSSHKYLKNSPHFWKTMLDYSLMKIAGAQIKPEAKEFLAKREAETYWYKHPSLKQSKDQFFSDDGLQYVYDHDSIHESVKLYDKPAYTYYLKDGKEVECDKGKFFALPEEYKLAGVIEEAMVLAIERSLVPHPGVKSPKEAWVFALSKVCSSITSGWFREYAYENAFKILQLYPEKYWEKFNCDLLQGKIKPFTKKIIFY